MTKLEDWITCCHSVKVLKSAGIDSIEQLSLLINVKTGGQKRQNVWEEITYTIFRKHPGFGIMNMCL